MYYLQFRDPSTMVWYRIPGKYRTPLAALEARDEEISQFANDGQRERRGCRAVDEDGNVLEYGERLVG